MDNVLQFWGKARAGDGAIAWHPIAYHLLDVAAVADAMLRARPLTRQRAGWLLGLPCADAHSLVVGLSALHDLGKFAPAFQRLAAPEGWVWPTALANDANRPFERSVHTHDGFILWQRSLRSLIIADLWTEGHDAIFELECAVFGHHGRPVDGGGGPLSARFSEGAVRAATDCARRVIQMTMPTPVAVKASPSSRYRIASWWLAGFLTVADWIGSRQEWFPYTSPIRNDPDLSLYWALAQARAAVAVRKAGMVAPETAALTTFSALTRKATPTAIQRWAETVAIPAAPTLFIVEDATGSGKTEAAQMLVHRMMASGQASGAYWAMPTQATANAMYSRQLNAMSALYPPDGDPRPSLTLGHGQSRLHDRYQSTVIRSPDAGLEPTEGVDPAGDDSAAVACASFLADDRRASLLANVGVGTVDQALLGVLPTRFAAVRLFALSEKVIVLDEVHAFDAYMSTEAKQLLRFHAALGGAAILLSATLPESRRRELALAWRCDQRFGHSSADTSGVSPYPLATSVNALTGETSAYTPPVGAVAVRRTAVRMVHDEGQALEHLLEMTAAGGSAVWIRNTVDECLRTAVMLEKQGRAPIVFHARFAQADRQRIEADVLARFGVSSLPEQRRGAILVATQVVEQSLDLDFDVMISDLAPIDLLMQRAGRLWRHRHRARPVVLEEMVVLCPSTNGVIYPHWPEPLLRNTRYVYNDVGILWRTAMALQECPFLDAPSNLRALISRVYDAEDVPEVLERRQNAAIGEGYAAVAFADGSTLSLAEGYSPGANWSDDLRARTRLGEEQVPVRLAKVVGEQIVPWCDDAAVNEWKRWALSEVKLSAKRISWEAETTPEWKAKVDQVREGWLRFEQRTPVVVLKQASDGQWSGALSRGSDVLSLIYSSSNGLSYGE